jgi:hypothetical protein
VHSLRGAPTDLADRICEAVKELTAHRATRA